MQRRKLSLFWLCLLPFATAFPDPSLNYGAHDLHTRDPYPGSVPQTPKPLAPLDARGLKSLKGLFLKKTLYPECKTAHMSSYCETFCTCVHKRLQCRRSPGDMLGLEKQRWVEQREEICQQNCRCGKTPSKYNGWYGGYVRQGLGETGDGKALAHHFMSTRITVPTSPP